MSDTPFDNGLNDSNLPDFVQESPTTETPAEQEQAPQVQAPEIPPAYPGQQETQAQEETPEQKQARLLAGKYESVEKLEEGYRNIRELQRRTAERAKAYEQRTQEIEYQKQQYEQALARANQLLRAAAQAQVRTPAPTQPVFDEWGNPIQAPQQAQPQRPNLTPELVVPLVDRMVNDRIGQAVQQAQQIQQQNQQYQAAATAMGEFFQAHPEVEPEGAVDQDIAHTILELNEAWQPTGSILDISSREALDIAYEASQRPALAEVLKMHPEYIDTEAGMALARDDAARIEGASGSVTQAQGRALSPRPNTPVVERGSSQAPQAGTPLDEFEQARQEFFKAKQARGSDVFFG